MKNDFQIFGEDIWSNIKENLLELVGINEQCCFVLGNIEAYTLYLSYSAARHILA